MESKGASNWSIYLNLAERAARITPSRQADKNPALILNREKVTESQNSPVPAS